MEKLIFGFSIPVNICTPRREEGQDGKKKRERKNARGTFYNQEQKEEIKLIDTNCVKEVRKITEIVSVVKCENDEAGFKYIKKQCNSKSLEYEILSELSTLGKPYLEYFPQVKGMAADKTFFLLEYCKGKTLTHYLANHKTVKIKKIITWIKQLLQIQEILEEKRIVHFDFKPDNLIVRDGKLVLIDFDVSSRTTDITDQFRPRGKTLGFQPHEPFREKEIMQRYDKYAIGKLIYLISTRDSAFDTYNWYYSIPKTKEPGIFKVIKILMRIQNLPEETKMKNEEIINILLETWSDFLQDFKSTQNRFPQIGITPPQAPLTSSILSSVNPVHNIAIHPAQPSPAAQSNSRNPSEKDINMRFFYKRIQDRHLSSTLEGDFTIKYRIKALLDLFEEYTIHILAIFLLAIDKGQQQILRKEITRILLFESIIVKVCFSFVKSFKIWEWSKKKGRLDDEREDAKTRMELCVEFLSKFLETLHSLRVGDVTLESKITLLVINQIFAYKQFLPCLLKYIPEQGELVYYLIRNLVGFSNYFADFLSFSFPKFTALFYSEVENELTNKKFTFSEAYDIYFILSKLKYSINREEDVRIIRSLFAHYKSKEKPFDNTIDTYYNEHQFSLFLRIIKNLINPERVYSRGNAELWNGIISAKGKNSVLPPLHNLFSFLIDINNLYNYYFANALCTFPDLAFLMGETQPLYAFSDSLFLCLNCYFNYIRFFPPSVPNSPSLSSNSTQVSTTLSPAASYSPSSRAPTPHSPIHSASNSQTSVGGKDQGTCRCFVTVKKRSANECRMIDLNKLVQPTDNDHQVKILIAPIIRHPLKPVTMYVNSHTSIRNVVKNFAEKYQHFISDFYQREEDFYFYTSRALPPDLSFDDSISVLIKPGGLNQFGIRPESSFLFPFTSFFTHLNEFKFSIPFYGTMVDHIQCHLNPSLIPKKKKYWKLNFTAATIIHDNFTLTWNPDRFKNPIFDLPNIGFGSELFISIFDSYCKLDVQNELPASPGYSCLPIQGRGYHRSYLELDLLPIGEFNYISNKQPLVQVGFTVHKRLVESSSEFFPNLKQKDVKYFLYSSNGRLSFDKSVQLPTYTIGDRIGFGIFTQGNSFKVFFTLNSLLIYVSGSYKFDPSNSHYFYSSMLSNYSVKCKFIYNRSKWKFFPRPITDSVNWEMYEAYKKSLPDDFAKLLDAKA